MMYTSDQGFPFACYLSCHVAVDRNNYFRGVTIWHTDALSDLASSSLAGPLPAVNCERKLLNARPEQPTARLTIYKEDIPTHLRRNRALP